MIKVAVAGYFDPAHEGHLDHIEVAKALGDWLVVIAGTEEQCDKKHGGQGRHFHSWEGKVRLLKKLGADEVVPNMDTDGSCAETLRWVRPNIFAKGGEDTMDTIPANEIAICREIGCQIMCGVGRRLNRSSKFWSR